LCLTQNGWPRADLVTNTYHRTVASNHQPSITRIPPHIISITLFFSLFTLKGLITINCHPILSPSATRSKPLEKVSRSRSAPSTMSPLRPIASPLVASQSPSLIVALLHVTPSVHAKQWSCAWPSTVRGLTHTPCHVASASGG